MYKLGDRVGTKGTSTAKFSQAAAGEVVWQEIIGEIIEIDGDILTICTPPGGVWGDLIIWKSEADWHVEKEVWEAAEAKRAALPEDVRAGTTVLQLVLPFKEGKLT